MIIRIKKNYPKYKFIITGDGLYSTTPIINLCKNYKWYFIFNLKPDRLKNINDLFEDNINYKNEVNIKNYNLSTNNKFKNNLINEFKYIETKKEKKTTFRYINNLDINNRNIRDIVNLGRICSLKSSHYSKKILTKKMLN